MPVKRAMREIDSAEFTEWLAYYDIEPFGERIADMRAGGITSAVYNVNRDTRKRPEPFRLLDFIPWVSEAQPEASEAVLLGDADAQSSLISAALFGKTLDGKKAVHGGTPGGANRAT